ncbi:MAG TPA: T9SS type A sorting domain-containing protein [Bacteroidia bacterium]
MKAKILFFGMPLFILSGVLFGQAAMTGSSHDFDALQSQPVYLSGGGTFTPDNNGDATDPSNSSDDINATQQRIFNGGGHVTVQDILGVFPEDKLHQSSVIGIEQTSSTDSNNPISVTSPTVNPNHPNNSLTTVHTNINVYPNPTSDQCNVVTEGEIIFGVVEIIDVTGKTVKKMGNVNQTGQGSSITIPVNDLKPGIYLIRFQTNKDIHVKRLQVR